MAVKEPIIGGAIDVGGEALVHHFCGCTFERNSIDDVFGVEELVESSFGGGADVEALCGDG